MTVRFANQCLTIELEPPAALQISLPLPINLCLVGIESIAFNLPENVLSYLFFGPVKKLAMSWSCKTSSLSGNAGAVLTTSRNERFFVPMVVGPY